MIKHLTYLFKEIIILNFLTTFSLSEAKRITSTILKFHMNYHYSENSGELDYFYAV